LVVAAVFTPFQVQAFNSATHVYITEQVAKKVFPLTFDKTDLYYGSIAPDISMYADISKWPLGFCETHYEFTILPYTWWKPGQRAFAQGWQIHNEQYPWGADYYAHGTCGNFGNCCAMQCTYNGYVPSQAYALASNYPILQKYPDLAHFAIEVAIDLLLIDDRDQYLGQKLLGAAIFRSPEVLKLLAKVPFVMTDSQTLYSAETTFRNLVINYASALSLPNDLKMAMLGELGIQIAKEMGVPDTEIDSAQIREILGVAKDLCRPDYYHAIQSAIDGIISNKSKLIK
jgi:hypothetical protein